MLRRFAGACSEFRFILPVSNAYVNADKINHGIAGKVSLKTNSFMKSNLRLGTNVSKVSKFFLQRGFQGCSCLAWYS